MTRCTVILSLLHSFFLLTLGHFLVAILSDIRVSDLVPWRIPGSQTKLGPLILRLTSSDVLVWT